MLDLWAGEGIAKRHQESNGELTAASLINGGQQEKEGIYGRHEANVRSAFKQGMKGNPAERTKSSFAFPFNGGPTEKTTGRPIKQENEWKLTAVSRLLFYFLLFCWAHRWIPPQIPIFLY